MFTHEAFVAFSKSYGLFYLIVFFLCSVIYAYWPSNKEKFDHVAKSIFQEEEE